MNYPLSDPMTSLSRCPHCSTAKPTLHLKAVVHGKYEGSSLAEGWAIFQCSSCLEIVCFKGRYPIGGTQYSSTDYFQLQTQYGTEMMPKATDDFTDWPERARRYMEQAVETVHAPDAAVMLTGSAVDAMLKEKGLTTGSVYARIEKAVQDHLLTPDMGEWAHSVRLAANSPRHADIDDPHATAEEALASLDFTKALGQFLFVLPARVKRGKEAAEVASDKAGGAE